MVYPAHIPIKREPLTSPTKVSKKMWSARKVNHTKLPSLTPQLFRVGRGLSCAPNFDALQLLQHPWVAQGHTKAGEHDLSHFKTAMKAYNARRKFKATIMTVQLMGTLGRVMKSSTAEKAAAANGDSNR